jgi:hypothetical protein
MEFKNDWHGIKISMQFFAEGATEGGSGDDSNKDESQEQNDNSNTQNQNSKDSNNSDVNLEEVKKQAKADYLKELGMSEEDVKKLVDDKKAKDESEKDNATKLTEALAEKAQAEAKVSAMMLGAKPDCVDDVIALATAKSSDGKDFKTVISEIKKKYSYMFTDSSDVNQTGKKGTGSPVPNGKNSKEKSSSMGKRLAEAKNANKKSSYFTGKRGDK